MMSLLKKLLLLRSTETNGGDDNTWRLVKGLIPIPSYITDKLGFGRY
jgi:hypothetical protein